jgi:hypothetical protein
VADLDEDDEDDAPRKPAARASSSTRDLDGPSRSSSGSTAKKKSSPADDTKAALTARIGYSRFQGLAFVTYGAEAAFLPAPRVAVTLGVEAYSTRRLVDPALVEQGAPPVQWNTILPIDAGVAYRFTDSNVRPYIGGGAQFIPGYVKGAGGVAIGLRARAGADFLVTDSFGFNLNAAAGLWSGQGFEAVDSGFGSSGIVPQFSGGTVVLF